MLEHADTVSWFRHSSPYINSHRGKTFVVMLSGEALADANLTNIIHDLALLHSLGVKLVLVHGARPQIAQLASSRGLSNALHHDRRITDGDTLQCVIEAVGKLRIDLEARMSLGLVNTPMHNAHIRLCSGNFVTAKPVGVHEGVDLCHTGEVRRVDKDGIVSQLSLGNMVLLSSLGYSPTGEVFNLSVEDVAANTAIALKADKLILFGREPGIRDSQGVLRSELLARTAERLLQQYQSNLSADPEQAHSETAKLIQAATQACAKGVERCHLIGYQQDGALLSELFTRDGKGTMIIQESYEQVRPASIDDVGGIIELISPLEQQGVLVRRSRELLEAEIEQFAVIERDGAIIGCAALYSYEQSEMAELACVAIDDSYRGGDRGLRLLEFIEQQAREQGKQQLFVLTTRTAHWFIEQGFAPLAIEQLPTAKQQLYNFQRNSKVFAKAL